MTLKDSGLEWKSLLGTVRAWARERLPKLSLDDAEALAQALGRVVATVILETALEQTAGPASYEGTGRACACGQTARFVGYRPRWLRTLCGDLRVPRAYYHCAACHTGQAPWDGVAGLDAQIFSPGLKALVAECCARLTHRETEALLARVLDLRVEESCQQGVVGTVGTALRAEDAAVHHATFAALEPPPPTLQPPPERLYIGMDAAKAHIDGGWHDVKCGAIYRGERTELRIVSRSGPEETVCRDRSGPKQYVAKQEAASAFGERMYVAARGQGVASATEVVVIGDGADWIWNLAEEHFHGATQVLDYYHATEHIWSLSRALYGDECAQGQAWAAVRCKDLQKNGPKGLLCALARRKPQGAKAVEALRLARAYFRKNRARMEYGKLRARGVMIGSGPVEAACKLIVGQRLKGTGMRWSTEGADAMLAVRTAVLNGETARIKRLSRAA